MLMLLLEGDEGLSREVLKTLKHFINVEVCGLLSGLVPVILSALVPVLSAPPLLYYCWHHWHCC